MADEEHLRILRQGVHAWNSWREKKPDVEPDLTGANLSNANLSRADLIETYLTGANLTGANLVRASLVEANLIGADLIGADLSGANLARAYLTGVNLTGANLSEANFTKANLTRANLTRANLNRAKLRRANLTEAELTRGNLNGADLSEANLMRADFIDAYLIGANLIEANLTGVNLTRANLAEANLTRATLVDVILEKAILSGCRTHGIFAWNMHLEGAEQSSLIITHHDQPTITVDNLELAQFIYLMLNNRQIRDVVDTMAQKVVLILGCLNDERKKVLEAVADELRTKYDRYPVMFDFEKPGGRDFMETISTLARMSRFVVADFTDAKFALEEAHEIVENIAAPIVPLLKRGGPGNPARPPMALYSLRTNHRSLLETHWYSDIDDLRASFEHKVIVLAENKLKEIQKMKAEELLRSLEAR